MESPTYTVQSSGTHTDSTTGVRYKVKSGEVITMQRAVNLGLPGAALPGDRNAETQPRTATTTGAGAGTIADPHSGSVVVEVTVTNAAHLITLPDAALGAVVCLLPSTTGYNVQTHDPATVGINGGIGASAKSAVAADTRIVAQRVTATNWVADATGSDGTAEPAQVAA